MTDRLNITPKGGNDDDNVSNSSYQQLTSSLRILEGKRRTYRRTLQQYERIKSRYVDNISKLNKGEPINEGKERDAAEGPVDPKKQIAIASYRLLRNFCISYNMINLSKKEDDRLQFPDKYAKEIETVLSNKATVEKYQKALKAENVESSIAELPNEVPEALVKNLIDFINKYDQQEIVNVFNQDLEKMTAEIDTMRAEQKTMKIAKKEVSDDNNQKQTKRAPKRINDDGREKTTEQRFRDLIKEVQQRVSQIKLEKDDFQTYSEAQSEVDNFLAETTTEILNIKKGLRMRFDNVQNGKFEYKKKQRNNRAREPREQREQREPRDQRAQGGRGGRGGRGGQDYNGERQEQRGGRRAYDEEAPRNNQYQVKK